MSRLHDRDHRIHRRMTSTSGQIHLNCLKKGRSSASHQTIRIKTESSQVWIQLASIDILWTHDIQQGISTRCQENKSYHRHAWTNQPKGSMLTYLRKFLPNLATKTAPLRLLLEEDTIWFFDKPQSTALQDLQKMVTRSPTLKYSDPKLPINVSSDASAQGLGALLEQLHEIEGY